MGIPQSTENFLFRDTPWLGFTHDGFPCVPLQEYKTVRGLGKASSSAGEDDTAAVKDRAALCQSLLTFGLLEAVLEFKVPERALLETDSEGRTVVTSKNLPSILLEWFMRIQTAPAEASAQWLERIHAALLQAHHLLYLQMQPEKNFFLKAGLGEEDTGLIICMVAAIGEALTNGKSFFPPTLPHGGFDWSFVLAFYPRYVHEAQAKGWCPATVRMLQERVSTLQYVALLEPRPAKSHRGCSRYTCIANSVDTGTYQTKHATAGCRCPFIKPPLEAVTELLSKGEVPIMTIEAPSAVKEEADVTLSVRSAAGEEYVAISHVWADGLGSTTEKGLPRCQLRKIVETTRKILPDGSFWIDALCVPELRDSRKRAIGLMGQTYRDATAVVVIDHGIRCCSIEDRKRRKLLHVRTSTWMTRLWTFQEAVLARKLLFEFADGLLGLDSLDAGYLNHCSDVVSVFLASEINRLGLKTHGPGGEHMPVRPDFGIGHVARGIQRRTTSKPGDETLAVASLLNLDGFELAGMPAEKRMMHLLTRVRNLPRNILFLIGPKLDAPGFRWAPKTFMSTLDTPALSTQRPDATCTPEGLVAEYGAIRFRQTTLKAGQTWLVQVPDPPGTSTVTVVETQIEGLPTGDYTCNALLFGGKSGIEQFAYCVAVLIDVDREAQDHAGGKRLVYCEYKKRLVTSAEPATVKSSTATLLDGTFGALTVCVG